MNLSFKLKHLKRYRDIALLVLKYGRPEMVQQFGLRAALTEDEFAAKRDGHSPDELAADLEKMGPTFVKIGQVLSSRADLLPKPYLDALARLQDEVKPFPYEEVEKIVTTELGVRLSKAFKEFDHVPLAAASLGQVHAATLHSGKRVVVKVQRPDIRRQIAEDLEVIEEIVDVLEAHSRVARRYQFKKIFEECQKTLIYELDYHREAANMVALGRNLANFPTIVVPQPIDDYTTRGILTMDYIDGKKIPKITPLEQMDINGQLLADQLFRAYLRQVLVDGLFHADPHPGNVFLTEDKKIALLDLGMVGRTTPEMQEKLIKLILAIADGRGETAAEIAEQMSETTAFYKQEDFRRKISGTVAEQQEATLEKIDVGRVILEIGRTAGENGLFVPVELTMLGKTLLQLDQIGRKLDPAFNPNEAVKRHVNEILNERLKKDLSPQKFFSSLLEVKDFIGGLPGRVNKILDAVGNSEVEVNVKAPQINFLIEGFQKVANRITTGLILASLIVGAALLMQVQTRFTILGYPGLAMLCFLAAAGIGFFLIFTIMFTDRKSKRREREQRQ